MRAIFHLNQSTLLEDIKGTCLGLIGLHNDGCPYSVSIQSRALLSSATMRGMTRASMCKRGGGGGG